MGRRCFPVGGHRQGGSGSPAADVGASLIGVGSFYATPAAHLPRCGYRHPRIRAVEEGADP
jgi:hypothetical protein